MVEKNQVASPFNFKAAVMGVVKKEKVKPAEGI